MFLTHEQLHELTGCARVKGQIEWLKARRYPFELDSKGRPKVLRACVDAKLGANAANEPSGPKLRFAS